MIESFQEHHDIDELCEFLSVSRSGFYDWRNRPVSEREKENKVLAQKIHHVFGQSRQTYGALRVTEQLKEEGVTCGKNRVARLMQQEGLRSVHRQKWRPCTTDSKHDMAISPNVISQDFTAKGPNEKWGCDISYIPTQEGFVYLAIVLDFYSRKIIGFAMGNHMRADLCAQALFMAIALRGFPKKIIHHTDRGSQYASQEYRNLLQEHGFIQSMSRTGNCWDNAMVESFFHTLKVELVHRYKYKTHEQAKEAITDYIYNFYNTYRKHSSLDYQAPNTYEKNAA